jgi:hypothetical protein
MVCIIIPIYKDTLSEYEVLSLKQCCSILFKYPIIFVTHKNLDCSVYTKICKDANINYKYEYFNIKYFKDILCYNALLLSRFFYARFTEYEYMLIYQLDSYVFRDELEYWCNIGYDYIGAPWLKLSASKTTLEFFNTPAVGNGGFSLRKIKRFIALYNKRISIIRFIHLFSSKCNEMILKKYSPRFLKIFFNLIIRSLKYFFFIPGDCVSNEDTVWSHLFQKKGYIPEVSQAMAFSFENYPEYLYKLNNFQLPFGCHDWYKYYNLLFYKNYINIPST